VSGDCVDYYFGAGYDVVFCFDMLLAFSGNYWRYRCVHYGLENFDVESGRDRRVLKEASEG